MRCRYTTTLAGPRAIVEKRVSTQCLVVVAMNALLHAAVNLTDGSDPSLQVKRSQITRREESKRIKTGWMKCPPQPGGRDARRVIRPQEMAQEAACTSVIIVGVV